MRIFSVVLALLLLPTAEALANLDLPVDGVITSTVGWRNDPFGTGRQTFHRGTDIAVPVGTPVRSTREGRVVFAGERRGYGATVIVEHDNGDRTLYGHNSTLKARSGDTVASGAVLALSGNTGRSTGPHVHYEVMPSGKPEREQVAPVEVAASGRPAAGDPRRQLEQKMDESLKSLLENIRTDLTGS